MQTVDQSQQEEYSIFHPFALKKMHDPIKNTLILCQILWGTVITKGLHRQVFSGEWHFSLGVTILAGGGFGTPLKYVWHSVTSRHDFVKRWSDDSKLRIPTVSNKCSQGKGIWENFPHGYPPLKRLAGRGPMCCTANTRPSNTRILEAFDSFFLSSSLSRVIFGHI